MKKFILILFYLFLIIFQNHAQNNKSYDLLWRIEGKGMGAPSYLFGTMHVTDSRAFNFSDSVMLAINRCKSFAMEIHPDTMVNVLFNNLFNSDSNKTIKALFSDAEYNKMADRFEEETGLSLDMINLKYPFFIKSLIPGKSDRHEHKSTFVDAYLLGIARTLHKDFYGLERAEDQLKFFETSSK